MSSWTFGETVAGLTVDGREVRTAVFNEHGVRAAAGLTMVIGAVAFAYAYFDRNYVPLQVVTVFFFIEFLTRVTAGLKYSPMGVIGRYRPWATLKQKYTRSSSGRGSGFGVSFRRGLSGIGKSVVIGRACVSHRRPAASMAHSVSCGAP